MAKTEIAERNRQLDESLAKLETSPAMRQLREQERQEALTRRQELATEMAKLKTELEGLPLPDRAAPEERAKLAKLKEQVQALEEAVLAKVGTVVQRRSSLGVRINKITDQLHETADPALDEAREFFQGRLDRLRKMRIVNEQDVGALNLLTLRKKAKTFSNREAINKALRYCQAAIAHLAELRLLPAPDPEHIEKMKTEIPDPTAMEPVGEVERRGMADGADDCWWAGIPLDSIVDAEVDGLLRKADDLERKQRMKK